MMKNLRFLLPLFFVIVFAACGGQAESADTAPASINLDELPQEVDVQTVFEIQDREDVFVIDVREQYEYDEKHIPNVTLLPMSEIENRIDEIPTDQEVIVTCRSGNRSGQVAQFLRQNGFDNVHNMQGGIIAWEEAGLPVER
jgi:rhodanese-related sulfurtransferase